MKEFELLANAASEMGIPISESQVTQFKIYMELLLEWNEKVNLTAITAPADIILKHFVDSMTVLPYVNGGTMIDVGTGAGFPGVPIKIMAPDIKLTLMDSLNKRVNFLNELVHKLGITSVECVHNRAEDAARERFRENYDVVVSRAVANLSSLAEYCLPFAKIGGKFISMKGPDAKDEITAAKKAVYELGGEITEHKTVKIPFSDMNHSLIIISKVRHTPDKYPRKAIKIAKNPIM